MDFHIKIYNFYMYILINPIIYECITVTLPVNPEIFVNLSWNFNHHSSETKASRVLPFGLFNKILWFSILFLFSILRMNFQDNTSFPVLQKISENLSPGFLKICFIEDGAISTYHVYIYTLMSSSVFDLFVLEILAGVFCRGPRSQINR